MKRTLLLTFLLFGLVGMNLYGQGATTSSMTGSVTDEGGEVLIGANITAMHNPTGSRYATITDIDGSYTFSNMRVGGPYTITASYVGYGDSEVQNIFLELGKKRKLNIQMSEDGVILDEIAIVSSTIPKGTASGTSTQITSEDIESMPTLNRQIGDFAKLTPQATESFGGGISLAGQNNRYNAIYIDGAVNNDVFGLAANGQNGGQTGIAPISIDAIDQIQVVLSPYDVTYGGFAGGGINAVTKSGTNELKGSAYYYLQNQSLAGKTNSKLTDRTGNEAVSLDEFSQKLYGLSLGGALVKNKAFLFVNAEIQRDETPVPFGGEYDGDATLAEIEQLGNYVQSQYGYDAGPFGNKSDKLDGTRVFAKLDYNISDNHKLSIRHNYTKAEQLNVNGSGQRNMNFEGNGVFFPSTTNSSAIELNSNFGTKASNNLIIGYTTVRDDRDPIGMDFPAVRIDDGQGRIFLGSEAFSTANALDQNVLTITDNLKLYKGKHTITIGTHNEFLSVYNLFIRQNFGAYTFNSLDDFYNGIVDDYDRSYSLVDDVTGDGSAAAAEFDAMQLGFYVQDEYAVNNKLTITGGIRLDVPIISTDPTVHSTFNSTTLPLLAARYDLEGAQGGQAPGAQLMFSPRLGINYDMDINTTIRGGIGIFTSRVPFVWPGGMYTNNGISIGGLDERDFDNPDDLQFRPDAQNQYTNPNVTIPAGQVDLFTENFKFPQVFRTNLGIDKTIGNGWNVTLEGIYTKTLNNIYYNNVNTDPTVDFNWTNGSDRRPSYTGGRLDPTYTAVYLGSNTNEGYSYNLTAQVKKDFENGFDLMAAWSYGDSESIFEGTSSQNSSQWRGSFHVDGRNNPVLGRSDFAMGTRIIGAAGYSIDWTKNGLYNTNISLFYNGQSGMSFSYVYNERDILNESGSTSRERALIYVPATQAEANLVDDGNRTPAQQWDLLNTFIEEDGYLASRRGQYAEKNGSRAPFAHQFDLRIAQNIGTNVGGKMNRLELTLDLFNVGNLINSGWGVRYNNPFNYRILDFEGYAADGTTPQFSFNETDLGNERFGIWDRGSRWRGRLGIRYIFN